MDDRRAQRRGAYHFTVELSGIAGFGADGRRARRRQFRLSEAVRALTEYIQTAC